MSNLKKDSKLYKLLEFIFNKGSVYKQDCVSYSLSLCSDKSNASKLISELCKRDFIYLKDFTVGKRRRERKTVSVVLMTEQGQRIMERFLQGTSPEQFRRIKEQFKTTSHDTLTTLYNQNHIKTMFNIAGIETEPTNKPSLEQLYYYVNNLIYTPQVDSDYKLYSEDELDQLYCQGIYYSDAEYKQFYNNTIGGGEIISSIFRGLFLSADKCLVVYSNGKNNSRMLYLKQEASEIILMNNLKAQNFARTRTITNGTDEFKVSLSALTMSDTNSFIYSTAIGRRNGKTNAKSPKTLKTKSVVFSGMSSINQDGAGDAVYNCIYSVVYNQSGSNSLKYLVSHSAEEHIKTSNSLADINSNISTRSGVVFPLSYRFRDMQYPCIYMPVYEIKTLNFIKELDFTPVIITKKDMTNVISHCTHKQHIFIDIETMKPMSNNNTMIYDSHGHPKGKKILEDYLHAKGLTITGKQFKELPKLYDMEYIEFYNQVAQGKISPEEIERQVETKPYEDKRYYKERKSHIYIPKSLYDEMKKYSELHNVTMFTTAIRFFSNPDVDSS